MALVRTLTMTFDTEMGTTMSLSIPNVKSDLTVAGVRETMDVIIANPIFPWALTDKVGAQITMRETNKLF